MTNVVLLKSQKEISEIRNFYQKYVIDKTPAGALFVAKTPNCTITAYKSGKVMFQGGQCESEASKWGGPSTGAGVTSKKEKSSPSNRNLPANLAQLSLIGSDEVGTGDFFGPITVVAAYVKTEDIALVKELGVQDSKNLNDEKICKIAKDLLHVVPHSLLTLKNDKYNELQQQGMSQGKMKAILHNQAIGHLLKKIAPITPEAILIDQFVQSTTYYQHLLGQKQIIRDKVLFSTKSEGLHVAVAAASIIARFAFVKHFENLSLEAGFTLPKGAGAQVDVAGARLIREKGEAALPHFVKLHFANTEKAKKKLGPL